MSLEHKTRTVANLIKSPLDKFITLDAKYCVHEGTTNEFIVKWVHPFLLEARSEASKEDKTQLEPGNECSICLWIMASCIRLEIMGAWYVIDCEYDMNVIRLTWNSKLTVIS